MKYVIQSKELYLEHEVIKGGSVLVEDGVITAINQVPEDAQVINMADLKVLPGLIDQHVHGGNGHDVMNSTYDTINSISKYKVEEGVTSFFPTTVTSSMDSTYKAVENVADCMEKGVDGAKVMGTFLESRYIAVKYKGAHPEEHIKDINIEEIKKIIDVSRGTMRAMIIAPEKKDAMEAIQYIVSRGVRVSLGHTAATYEEMQSGIRAGGTIATHAYNAMSPLLHRDPGAVGAIMNHDAIYAEAICDTIHVHPSAIEVLIRAKGKDKVILVTDCIMAGGLPDGKAMLGELEVFVKNGEARIANGALAGSTLKLIDGVKNLVKHTAVTLREAVNMASINSAKAHQLDNEIGSLAIGKKADIIAIDNDYQVKFVMIDGKIIKK